MKLHNNASLKTYFTILGIKNIIMTSAQKAEGISTLWSQDFYDAEIKLTGQRGGNNAILIESGMLFTRG
jgi:hypothetical protein